MLWCWRILSSYKSKNSHGDPDARHGCHGGRTIGRHVRVYFGHCQALSGSSWLVPARLGETWKLQAFAAALIPFQSLSPKYGSSFLCVLSIWSGEAQGSGQPSRLMIFGSRLQSQRDIFFLKPQCAGSCKKESVELLEHACDQNKEQGSGKSRFGCPASERSVETLGRTAPRATKPGFKTSQLRTWPSVHSVLFVLR